MAAFPMPACPLEARFDDQFVGTLHHARANRPALASELGILHQPLAFAETSPDARAPLLVQSIQEEGAGSCAAGGVALDV